MPYAVLAIVMMIIYAPEELYTYQVTVMDIICASVCITSRICFTLGKTHRDHNALDAKFGDKQFRMSARGSATSFPLPREDVLQHLHHGNSMEDLANMASLPRTGPELANIA